MRKIGVAWAVVVLAWCGGAWAEGGPSFDDLTALVQSSQARTVEDLLNALPADYVGFTALMHHSRSLQPSSMEAPRIILASNLVPDHLTAKRMLFMGVGGHAQQGGDDTVEVIEFATDKPGFQFHRLVFYGAAKPPTIEKDPRVCVTCHGTPARPIWDTYGTWPGAYGSITTNTGRPADKWELDALKALPGLVDKARYGRFVGTSYDTYEGANDEIGKVINDQIARTEASLFMAAADYQRVVPALQASRAGGDFVNLLPTDLRPAAAALYPQAVKDVCDSLKRTAVNKMQRMIADSNGRLERRIFDFWDVGSLDFNVRLLTLRRLLHLPSPDGSWSSQFPRELAATADGQHGVIMALLYALVPAFSGHPHTIYDPQNGMVLDDNLRHLKISFPTDTCGAIDATW